MLHKVRTGYVVFGKTAGQIFKAGDVIDDQVVPVKGQEHKLEPVNPTPQAPAADAGAAGAGAGKGDGEKEKVETKSDAAPVDQGAKAPAGAPDAKVETPDASAGGGDDGTDGLP